MSKKVRVVRDDKFIVIKVFDNLTREQVFVGKALLSDAKAKEQLFLDATAKGFDLR
jgi:hypothetical protein